MDSNVGAGRNGKLCTGFPNAIARQRAMAAASESLALASDSMTLISNESLRTAPPRRDCNRANYNALRNE